LAFVGKEFGCFLQGHVACVVWSLAGLRRGGFGGFSRRIAGLLLIAAHKRKPADAEAAMATIMLERMIFSLPISSLLSRKKRR